MKKIYFVLTLLFLSNLVSAQYSEVWKASYYFIGCENMDNDANKEIVALSLSDHNGQQIFQIIDGITGQIEWTSANMRVVYADNLNSPNPRLVDVNNDGIFEILFRGIGPGETDMKLHLFAFGALTKSAEISANSNVQIENYPNPFSTVTTIKYNVPVKSMVTVKVFDMNGNEIKTLANAQQSQGDYEIPFNRSDLQNGTYFYQVRVGSQVGAKKMIVIE